MPKQTPLRPILGAISEFEHALLTERTAEGLAAARAGSGDTCRQARGWAKKSFISRCGYLAPIAPGW